MSLHTFQDLTLNGPSDLSPYHVIDDVSRPYQYFLFILSPVFNYCHTFVPFSQYISSDMCHLEVHMFCCIMSILPLQINCNAEHFKCEKYEYQGTTLTDMNQVQDKI